MSVCLFYAKCASCQRWIIRVGIWALGNELHAVRWGMNPPSARIVLTCKHVTTHVCFTILVRTCSLVLSLILSKTEVLSNILLSLKNKQIVHGSIQTSGKRAADSFCCHLFEFKAIIQVDFGIVLVKIHVKSKEKVQIRLNKTSKIPAIIWWGFSKLAFYFPNNI